METLHYDEVQKDKKRSETQVWDPTKFGSQGEVLARTLTSWDESDKERAVILDSKCFKKAYTVPSRTTRQEYEHRLHYRNEWKGGNNG